MKKNKGNNLEENNFIPESHDSKEENRDNSITPTVDNFTTKGGPVPEALLIDEGDVSDEIFSEEKEAVTEVISVDNDRDSGKLIEKKGEKGLQSPIETNIDKFGNIQMKIKMENAVGVVKISAAVERQNEENVNAAFSAIAPLAKEAEKNLEKVSELAEKTAKRLSSGEKVPVKRKKPKSNTKTGIKEEPKSNTKIEIEEEPKAKELMVEELEKIVQATITGRAAIAAFEGYLANRTQENLAKVSELVEKTLNEYQENDALKEDFEKYMHSFLSFAEKFRENNECSSLVEEEARYLEKIEKIKIINNSTPKNKNFVEEFSEAANTILEVVNNTHERILGNNKNVSRENKRLKIVAGVLSGVLLLTAVGSAVTLGVGIPKWKSQGSDSNQNLDQFKPSEGQILFEKSKLAEWAETLGIENAEQLGVDELIAEMENVIRSNINDLIEKSKIVEWAETLGIENAEQLGVDELVAEMQNVIRSNIGSLIEKSKLVEWAETLGIENAEQLEVDELIAEMQDVIRSNANDLIGKSKIVEWAEILGIENAEQLEVDELVVAMENVIKSNTSDLNTLLSGLRELGFSLSDFGGEVEGLVEAVGQTIQNILEDMENYEQTIETLKTQSGYLFEVVSSIVNESEEYDLSQFNLSADEEELLTLSDTEFLNATVDWEEEDVQRLRDARNLFAAKDFALSSMEINENIFDAMIEKIKILIEIKYQFEALTTHFNDVSIGDGSSQTKAVTGSWTETNTNKKGEEVVSYYENNTIVKQVVSLANGGKRTILIVRNAAGEIVSATESTVDAKGNVVAKTMSSTEIKEYIEEEDGQNAPGSPNTKGQIDKEPEVQ